MLHSFNYTDGANPTGKLVADASGNLYGATVIGSDLKRCAGLGCGVIFRRGPKGDVKLLHIFGGPGKGDGANATHALIRDTAGNIYGTTENGGLPNCSNYEPFEPVATSVIGCRTIFKLDASGTETVLYPFNVPPDALNPRAPVIEDAAGNLYGTTFYGGLYGNGTVFKLDTTGRETVLYNFQGLTDGANPWAGLVQDAATGNLYGTTNHAGGACYCGTVFVLDPVGNYRVLHTFHGTDGQYSGEPLLLYHRALYGVTSGGDVFLQLSQLDGVILLLGGDSRVNRCTHIRIIRRLGSSFVGVMRS